MRAIQISRRTGIAVLAAALAAACLNGHLAPAPAQQDGANVAGETTLDQAVTSLAGKIDEFLKDPTQEGRRVPFSGIDEIKSPPAFKSANGEAIRAAVMSRLSEKHGIKPQVGGCTVRASYFVKMKPDNKGAMVTLVAKMVSSDGEEDSTFSFRASVADVEAIDRLLALNRDSATDAGQPADVASVKEDQAGKIAERLQPGGEPKPDAFVAPETPSVVAPKPGSPYRIEVCAVRNGVPVPLPVVVEGGLPFVHFQKGDAYVVRIINDSPEAVGVKLFIDGISMFEFTQVPQYRKNQMVWLGPGGKGLIRGWHLNDDLSKAFLIVALPDGVAFQRTDDPNKIGSITASFYASWDQGKAPPIGLVKGKGESTIATGVGQTVQAKYTPKYVEFANLPLATVSVRYKEYPSDLPPE